MVWRVISVASVGDFFDVVVDPLDQLPGAGVQDFTFERPAT
jgi:hypothetical protein